MKVLSFLKSRLVNAFCIFLLLNNICQSNNKRYLWFYEQKLFPCVRELTYKICICIDLTFNMSGGMILFVGFLRYFKDALIVMGFIDITVFLVVFLWFGFFLVVILYVFLNQSKVNENKVLSKINQKSTLEERFVSIWLGLFAFNLTYALIPYYNIFILSIYINKIHQHLLTFSIKLTHKRQNN